MSVHDDTVNPGMSPTGPTFGTEALVNRCLLPDDNTAVERLAAALQYLTDNPHDREPDVYADAEVIIDALREGGQRDHEHDWQTFTGPHIRGEATVCSICGKVREGGQRA